MYRYHGTKEVDSQPLAAARARGEAEHARRQRLLQPLEGTALPTRAQDRRCFVASVVYGPDAMQTHALRAWRDRALVPHWAGRVLVRLYYRASPPVARWLERHPRCQRGVRVVLDHWVGCIQPPGP